MNLSYSSLDDFIAAQNLNRRHSGIQLRLLYCGIERQPFLPRQPPDRLSTFLHHGHKARPHYIDRRRDTRPRQRPPPS